MNRKTAAFSLIELMVAITIVGILAAVGVPSYKSYMIKARVSNMYEFAEKVKVDLTHHFESGQSMPLPGQEGQLNYSRNKNYTEYITGVGFEPAWGQWSCPSGSQYLGGFIIFGNQANLGVTDDLTLMFVVCDANGTYRFKCGYPGSTNSSGNYKYLPSNCHNLM